MSDILDQAREAREGMDPDDVWVACNDGESCSVIKLGGVVARGMTAEDAAFTAAAHYLVPALIADNERLRESLAFLRATRGVTPTGEGAQDAVWAEGGE